MTDTIRISTATRSEPGAILLLARALSDAGFRVRQEPGWIVAETDDPGLTDRAVEALQLAGLLELSAEETDS